MQSQKLLTGASWLRMRVSAWAGPPRPGHGRSPRLGRRRSCAWPSRTRSPARRRRGGVAWSSPQCLEATSSGPRTRNRRQNARWRPPQTAAGASSRQPGSRLSAKTQGWRWRESNPRPTTHHQGFSERSPLCLCSTPPISRTSRCDGPSRCLVSRARPRPARTVSHLADARIRADDEPGLTESLRYLGSEGELALTGVGACVVSDAWLTSSSSASSARFPWSSDRSRDHSPPV